jgi:hypothetical protein
MFNIFVIIISIILALGVVSLFVFAIVRAINNFKMAFEGIVVDKSKTRDPSDMDNRGIITFTYRMRVKPDNAKEFDYIINSRFYEVVNVGDRVSKPHNSAAITIVTPSIKT